MFNDPKATAVHLKKIAYINLLFLLFHNKAIQLRVVRIRVTTFIKLQHIFNNKKILIKIVIKYSEENQNEKNLTLEITNEI